MASTYPLEVVQAARWVKANPNVKGDAAVKAVENQTWDVSVKSLVAFPAGPGADERQARLDAEARRRLPRPAEGRARRRAAPAREGAGVRQPQDHRAAEGHRRAGTGSHRWAAAADDREDRAGEPAGDLRADLQPDRRLRRLGLPGLSAVLLAALPGLYGYYPGAAFASGIAWGIGFAAAGAIFGNCNWGGGDVNININRATNIDRNFDRSKVQGGGRWQHDAGHRQGVAYRDNATREKFGRGQRRRRRAQRVPRRGGDLGDRGGAGGDRGGAGDRAGDRPASGGDRAAIAAAWRLRRRSWRSRPCLPGRGRRQGQRSATSTVGIRARAARLSSPAAGAAVAAVAAAAAAGAEEAAMRSTMHHYTGRLGAAVAARTPVGAARGRTPDVRDAGSGDARRSATR